MRIAPATLRFRRDPGEALRAVTGAMKEAARRDARIVCIAECYLPGLRGVGLGGGAPWLLVGNKSDLRKGASDPVATADGASLARDGGAAGFVECSALKQDGVNGAFDAAIRAALA